LYTILTQYESKLAPTQYIISIPNKERPCCGFQGGRGVRTALVHCPHCFLFFYVLLLMLSILVQIKGVASAS